MNKRPIDKNRYSFLQQELTHYNDSGIITTQQKNDILELYKLNQGLNFIRIVVLIGAILIGLGILSFVAGNWMYLSKATKFALIILLLISVNLASFKVAISYPKTSKGLLYIGILSYGAGIFLVGQIFNFGGHFTGAFLLWAVGVFPMALLFRDKIIFILSSILFLVYVNGYFELDDYPLAILLITPVLYYCNKYFNYSQVITFFNNLIVINTLGLFASKYGVAKLYTCLLYLLIGLAMFYMSPMVKQKVFELQGILLFGITGIFLTDPDVWHSCSMITTDSAKVFSIVFAIIFIIYLLSLVKKENFFSLIFICLTIFRYYVDTMYDFLPKSAFFMSGGLLLLGFGYYIERLWKRRRGAEDV